MCVCPLGFWRLEDTCGLLVLMLHLFFCDRALGVEHVRSGQLAHELLGILQSLPPTGTQTHTRYLVFCESGES